MPVDPLPDEVLAELGRLVWVALNLEGVVYTVCRAVQPRHGPSDDFPIGSRIDEALTDLGQRPADELRARAESWLREAKDALQDRNAVIHSTYVTFVPIADAAPAGSLPDDELWHVPRKGTLPAVRTPLTADGLRSTRERLEAAYDGWVDLAVELAARRRAARAL